MAYLQQEQRNGVSAEEFHSLGRQLHDVTERMDVRINPGPPGPDREMTFDEKRKLSVFMGALDGDKLGKVIEIIEQEQPDLPGKLPKICHQTKYHHELDVHTICFATTELKVICMCTTFAPSRPSALLDTCTWPCTPFLWLHQYLVIQNGSLGHSGKRRCATRQDVADVFAVAS